MEIIKKTFRIIYVIIKIIVYLFLSTILYLMGSKSVLKWESSRNRRTTRININTAQNYLNKTFK